MGRLAFDPDTGFHLAEDGSPLVTEDGGKTWRPKTDSDPTHWERYHKRGVIVKGTTDSDQHHIHPIPADPHFVEGATNDRGQLTHTRITFDPDPVAAKITGHTESWA